MVKNWQLHKRPSFTKINFSMVRTDIVGYYTTIWQTADKLIDTDESQRCYAKLRKPMFKSMFLFPFLERFWSGQTNKWFSIKLKQPLLSGLGGRGESCPILGNTSTYTGTTLHTSALHTCSLACTILTWPSLITTQQNLDLVCKHLACC